MKTKITIAAVVIVILSIACIVAGIKLVSDRSEATANKSIEDIAQTDTDKPERVMLDDDMSEDAFTVDLPTEPEPEKSIEDGVDECELIPLNLYRRVAHLSYEAIKSEEGIIRTKVNSGSCRQVTKAAGEDGNVHKRTYWYDGENLIFAFYNEATDGSEDQRFYFRNGCLIEYIEYTGNDAPENKRYYSSDSDGCPGEVWYDLQEEVLRAAGVNAAIYCTTDMADYEFMILMDRYWTGGNDIEIDFGQNDREVAIAALTTIDPEEYYLDKGYVEDDENIEYFFLDRHLMDEPSKNYFGRVVKYTDLPVYGVDSVYFGPCLFDNEPAYIRSYYENETSYNVISVKTHSDSEYTYVERELYCGYWGGDDGTPNYSLTYTLRGADSNYEICKLLIKPKF